jgi:hypothetical protein
MKFQEFSHQINSKQTKVQGIQNSLSIPQEEYLNGSQLEEQFSKPQDTICNFFLDKLNKETPDWVLEKFERLFISQTGIVPIKIGQALYIIVAQNQENTFRNTLKRSCYILINNWNAARNHKPIQKLIQLFSEVSKTQKKTDTTKSLTKQRLKKWIINFIESEDYQDLHIFLARYENRGKWSNHYASYLLASESLDSKNSQEQREAAKIVSQQLKKRFNLALAMYTARSNLAVASARGDQNPTVLGDNVLHLIHQLLAKRGIFSYANLANIFLKQTTGLLYYNMKQSLRVYLFFSLEKSDLLEVLNTNLDKYLESIYNLYDRKVWNSHLLLLTCNHLIEYLITQERGKPSLIFTWLVTHNQGVVLAILILKIILICQASYVHLENCIADLIQYYENEPESDCQWLIDFLETLTVTLGIYAENIRYNLVSIEAKQDELQTSDNFKSYWIFSQIKFEPEKSA